MHHGKAVILEDRCIDCGECVRTCPSQAKIALSDKLELESSKHHVAMVAPSFMAQFPPSISQDRILAGLKNLGFNQVFEVALSAEWMSLQTSKWMEETPHIRPAITSSCPVVVRLIQNRFPDLLENLLPLMSPMEFSARYIRDNCDDNTEITFISPCSAKLTATKAPRGLDKSEVDRVVGFNQIYGALKQGIPKDEPKEALSQASSHGLFWAEAGGEGAGLGTSYLRVDGINAVIQGLEQIENGTWDNYELVEFMSCPGGCLGGPLTVLPLAEARYNLEKRIAQMEPRPFPLKDMEKRKVLWEQELKPQPVYQLDKDYAKALKLMEHMEYLAQGLPGIDCGSCGAPTCKALAEDIVRGKGKETDCIFKQREKIRSLTEEMVKLQEMLPPSMG